MLGRLSGSTPDLGATTAVDLVCQGIAGIESYARDCPGKRRCDMVEGVVIIVQHDHYPFATQT